MTDDGSLFHVTLREALLENDRIVAASAESDRRIAKLRAQQTRRDDPEIYHRRYDPPPQQQVAAALSAEAQRRWDSWAELKIRTALSQFQKAEHSAIAHAISLMRAEWKAEVRKAVAEFERDFRLPVIEGWQPKHYLRGSIVCSGGGVYQSNTDTSFHPGHPSWNLLCAPGENGVDGRSWDDPRQRSVAERSVIDLPNPLRARRTDAA